MTITPGAYNFTIYAGSTFYQRINWSDSCDEPIDLTGYTAKLEAKYSISDADPFLSLTTENGGITLGGSAGTVEINADAAATLALTAGVGVYDLQMTSGAGVVDYLLQGKMTVQKMVTP